MTGPRIVRRFQTELSRAEAFQGFGLAERSGIGAWHS